MAKAENKTKRYNLSIPKCLMDQVDEVAVKKHTSKVNIIKKFLELGLMIESGQKKLFIKEKDGKEIQALIL